ncbi:HAD-IIIA family hydrolase [Frankia sp. Cppng1_Ct_nod]|uniref:D-glycero-alpha-D-manno-heptose-1,7-bisphosphate 7-phosphatase n=1 Tax=Frankia sp. Cppng1_Ct_nod TaxID=2897162 RepID=UPI001A946BA6|nr:HAD-IIIA family hydrolase [Frankia sp. Cppng1_Ct_nod]
MTVVVTRAMAGAGPSADTAEPLLSAARRSVSRPAVFLDRDGVLNEPIVVAGRPFAPLTAEEFILVPGVVEVCERLRRAGFALVVVTNQPEVARGALPPRELARMHAVLRSVAPVEGIYVCPHDDADACPCRKPAPGLALAAADELDLDLAASVVVGDRWRDIEMGHRLGCRTVLVDRGYSETRPVQPSITVRGLPEAVRWILDSPVDQGGNVNA